MGPRYLRSHPTCAESAGLASPLEHILHEQVFLQWLEEEAMQPEPQFRLLCQLHAL